MLSCKSILGILIFPVSLILFQAEAYSEQTKEQCDRCCRNTIQDEYYLDQCIVKCFRNHDHCRDGAAAKPSSPQPKPSPKAAQDSDQVTTQPQRPAQPKQTAPAVTQTQPAPAPKEQRPVQARQPFQWPDPLNLVPGREIEAAGQILVLNGMPPQHPNFQAASKAIEMVLVNFARNNPAGGRLPTAQLEQILRQYNR